MSSTNSEIDGRYGRRQLSMISIAYVVLLFSWLLGIAHADCVDFTTVTSTTTRTLTRIAYSTRRVTCTVTTTTPVTSTRTLKTTSWKTIYFPSTKIHKCFLGPTENVFITCPNTITRTTTRMFTTVAFADEAFIKAMQQSFLVYATSTVLRTTTLRYTAIIQSTRTLTRTTQATATAFTPRTSRVVVTRTVTSTAKQTRVTVLSLTASVTPSFSASPLLSLNAAAMGAEYFLGSDLSEGILPRGWWLLLLVGAHLIFG